MNEWGEENSEEREEMDGGSEKGEAGSSWYKLNQGIGVFPSHYNSPSVSRCVLCIGHLVN